MNDAGRMRGSETLRHRSSDFERLPPMKRRALDCPAHCFALKQFSHQKVWRVLQFGIVDRQNVGMRKGCDRFRFDAETRPQPTIDRQMLGENFDCNVAIEPCVPCPINLTHTPSADQCDDLVRSKPHGWLKGHTSTDTI